MLLATEIDNGVLECIVALLDDYECRKLMHLVNKRLSGLLRSTGRIGRMWVKCEDCNYMLRHRYENVGLIVTPRDMARHGKCKLVANLNPKGLRVCDFRADVACMEAVFKLKLTALQFLKIRLGIGLDKKVIKSICELSTLRCLDIRFNNLEAIGAKAVSALKNLQRLEISNNHISDEGACAIFQLKGLRHLDISTNKVTKVEAISALSNLWHLDISCNNIGDLGARAISDLFQLRYLDISLSRIGIEGAKALSKLTRLRCLAINDNDVGDGGAAAISDLINLQRLCIYSNNIGDKGAMALSKLTHLERLDVYGNAIKEGGARAISGLLKMRYLHAGNNNINVTQAECIFSKMVSTHVDLRGLKCFTDLHDVKHLVLGEDDFKIAVLRKSF